MERVSIVYAECRVSNLLKSATDSHGNVTSISYKKMPDTSIYTKTPPVGGSATVFGYDSLSFTAPFKLVSEVSISNGIGGNEQYCIYL